MIKRYRQLLSQVVLANALFRVGLDDIRFTLLGAGHSPLCCRCLHSNQVRCAGVLEKCYLCLSFSVCCYASRV